ncbi:MAG: glycosyltransferase family 4 protein [Candidatus Limnocylindrales bacterium]
MAQHDICVVPSANEPSSRVMVEAMLLGTAVIASDIGGNHEKAGGEARSALLYPLGDPAALAARLNELMSDEHGWREQSQRGHRWAREMFIEHDQLAPLFDELTALAARPDVPGQVGWISRELAQRATQRTALAKEKELLMADLDRSSSELERISSELAGLGSEAAAGKAEASAAKAETSALQTRVDIYEGSNSWRLTAPMRVVGRRLRSLFRGRTGQGS